MVVETRRLTGKKNEEEEEQQQQQEKYLPFTGMRTPDHPGGSLVAILTRLTCF
jgi:hypothetical protein